MIGNYYAFDAPAALNVPLQRYLEVDYDDWQLMLNALYSCYSLPNAVLPFISGIFISRHGPVAILVWCSGLVLAGQVLFGIGLGQKSYWLMLLGRIVFGVGGESVGVCQSCIIVDWFWSSKQISFCLGLTVTVARLGSVLNSNLSPRIERDTGSVPIAIGVATGVCAVSFASSLLLAYLIHHNSSEEISDREPLLHEQRDYETESTQSPVSTLIDPSSQHPGAIPTRSVEFWLIVTICVLLYGTIIPFNNTASDFLMEKWYPNDTVTAGFVMSIPDTLSMFLMPLSGMFIDRHGHKISLLLVCAIASTCAHLVLGLTYISPVIPMVLLGAAYSVYGSAIWGAIADVGKSWFQEIPSGTKNKHELGRAYGISTSVYNASLIVLPLISAEVRIRSGGFLYVEVFFATLGCIAVVCSLVLYQLDRANGGILEMGSKERLQRQEIDQCIDETEEI